MPHRGDEVRRKSGEFREIRRFFLEARLKRRFANLFFRWVLRANRGAKTLARFDDAARNGLDFGVGERAVCGL